MRHYQVYIDPLGEGRWRRIAGGRNAANSGEGYHGRTPREAVRKAERAVKADAGTMPYKIKYVDR